MPLTPEQRQAVIGSLTANCACWNKPGDAEVLNGFADDKLLALDEQRRAVEVANTAVRGFRDPAGNAYRINPETGQWEAKAAPTQNAKAAPKPAANAGKPFMKDEDEEEDDEEEEETKKENAKRIKGKATTNAGFKRPRTAEEWFDAAPADVQNTFKAARAWEDQERQKLVQRLAVNATEPERPARTDWLRTQPLDVLQNMASLLPAPAPSAPSTRNALPQQTADEDDILGLPVLNFEDPKADIYGRTAKQANNGGGMVGISLQENADDYADLPPAVRNKLAQADTLITRERTGLIEQLTANLDDEARERLERRLSGKSLDELRDMLLLKPKQEAAPPRYFGGAVPTANRGFGFSGGDLAGADDDVLPLPTMNFDRDDEDDRPAQGRKRRQA